MITKQNYIYKNNLVNIYFLVTFINKIKKSPQKRGTKMSSNDLLLILNKLKKCFTGFQESNARYLVTFKTSTINTDVKLFATDINNSRQYFCNISDKTFSTFQPNDSYNEFLENLHKIIVKKEFSFKKDRDSIIFHSPSQQINIILKINENYREIDYLKETCLNLYDKCNSLEGDHDTMGGVASNGAAFETNKSQTKLFNGKAGMSIINPQSRKRKTPRGVQFEDE
jgi:hypothetical protein